MSDNCRHSDVKYNKDEDAFVCSKCGKAFLDPPDEQGSDDYDDDYYYPVDPADDDPEGWF